MLDAFKNMTGGTGKQAQKQTEELELLIASAKEERGALSAMLTALTARTAKLTPMTKSLEQVTDTAASITTRLDDIAARLATLDDRTKELAEVDKRIQALKEAARQAEQTTQRAAGPDGELSPVQQGFRDCHGLQCGFCTPGFLTTITAGLKDNPDPTVDEAREMIGGNLCRCTGYQNIVAAVLRAAEIANEAQAPA